MPLRRRQAPLAQPQAMKRVVGAQHIADALNQDRPVERLADEIRRADRISLLDRRDVVEAGHHQNWRTPFGLPRPQPRTRGRSIHSRHDHIQQDDIGVAVGKNAEGYGAAFSLLHHETGGLQSFAAEKALCGIVIDDKDDRCGSGG